jgi:hypothetical protein
MAVKVDVRDATGPVMATKVSDRPRAELASDGNDADTEAKIAKIIAENSGSAS